MERLDTNIRALDGTLQETPEVLQPVRVNHAVNVGLGVIHNLVSVFVKAIVGLQRIGVECGLRLHVLTDRRVKVMLPPRADYRRANLPSLALKQAEHDSLAHRPTAFDLFRSLVRVHKSCFATDEGFVGFDFAGHFVDAARVHGVTDSVRHKPCRSLSDLEIAGHFVAANAVLAVPYQPHRHQPLVQWDRAVFEDRTDFDGELLPAFKTGPHQPRLEKRQPFGSALRALWTIGPLGFRNSFKADHWVRKVLDGFNQTTLFVQLNRFHTSRIHLSDV